MDECIFCKIISGELDCDKVYEDDDVLAFRDMFPQSPVHTLIVPKKHYSDLSDNIPEEILGKVFSAVSKVAKLEGIEDSGYRIISNKGAHAQQSVFHLHVHVHGGARMHIDSPIEGAVK